MGKETVVVEGWGLIAIELLDFYEGFGELGTEVRRNINTSRRQRFFIGSDEPLPESVALTHELAE